MACLRKEAVAWLDLCEMILVKKGYGNENMKGWKVGVGMEYMAGVE